ncbi:MAG: hypothetical protein ACLQRH_16115 [Acidimicrobiales bacterium]
MSEVVDSFAAFDPFDPSQASRHHEIMSAFRSRCPIGRLSSGLDVVSRCDDVRATLNEATLRNSHATRAPGVSVPADDRLFFFEYDPPEHTALRRLLVDLLSRQRSELRAPAMRAVVEDLPAPLVSAVRVDLVQEFSVPLAGRIMMQVAGFPDEDAGQ